MTAHAQTTPATQSLRSQIYDLAHVIQRRASQAATLNDCAADILSDAAGEPSTQQLNSLHHLMDMALAHSLQLADLGEKVELLAKRVPMLTTDPAPAGASTEWERLVAAERAAFAAMEATNTDETTDAATDAWSEAQSAMMNHPAPDLAALRYKLDRLFPADADETVTNCWAWDHAGQTIRDMRRLLPGGAA